MHEHCFLVSCVGEKVGHPAKARDLYASAWFTKARTYVEWQGGPWFILSAEYGLVDPDTIIAPYEKTLNTMGVRERREWAKGVIEQLTTRLPDCEKIVILAGARYREFLMDYLRTRADRVEIPLEGLRIGEQLSWLGSHLQDFRRQ